ncbi:patatin-like phospholipase family protein [Pseudenhygromyxa sp. WMMC2535]|uniref:patatin-like phospholipase family protein n=1 Tax=Pseudenhygromyxa sp. WMMC2535 TaxID=2712867 RepID=UPI001555D70F|nr:patatin-like phospholipase family protein [Pseudenhygromyxa sp. WMMC2535]NVB37418.1 patatin-like phospholipase family protein [Pseudenhygromyxa sp. WMMC2535]
MSEALSIVLSGGGCKAFWAMGAYDVLGDVLPQVTHWAGVSAGAGMALARAADRFDECLELFLEAVEHNARNVYPQKILKRERAFPHDDIYRAAVRRVFHEGGFERLRAGAPVYILLSYIKAGYPQLPTSWSAVRKFAEARKRKDLHGPEAVPRGIGQQVVCSRDAIDTEQLLDWVMMSSTIPPFTRVQRRAGRTYLDGGLIDNAPIRALPAEARGEGRKVLCLISHAKPTPTGSVRAPSGAQVLYLAARRELPVRIWDYTSPERIREIIEIGREDGAAHRGRLEAFLNG